MGMYFAIIFYNTNRKEYKKEEVCFIKPYEDSWNEVLKIAMELEKELFSKDKYWVIKEIKDITNRG